ncbi:MAG: crosslink repair DNA glycosylase YcaQ family protein [Acidimicrobiales bacterium]
MPGARSLSSSQLSNREARWLALAAQGLSEPRPATAAGRRTPAKTRAQLRSLMGQLGTIQLDAVNVLARTQFLVPFSRLGPYDPAVLRSLSGPQGSWFEYWGHAASLLPVALHPLLRWRMQRWRDDLVDSGAVQERRRAWRADNSAYIASVLAEVTERGPLAASQLSEPRRQSGQWWDRRSTGRRALELLFGDGVLSAWRSASFERIYDLTERVVPAAVLEIPTPSDEDAQKQLIVLAARCMGAATEADLADYFWLRPQRARVLVADLVGEGRLIQVAVEGWPQPAYVVPGVRPRPPKRESATLVSPFDSLIWARPRVERLFEFHYRIEIYVPGELRTHGYYVMPLLLGDALVARFDLKSDRHGDALLVVGAFAEAGQASGAVAEAAFAELQRLREWLGLSSLLVAPKGDLAPRLPALGRPAGLAKKVATKQIVRPSPGRPSPGP